MLIYDARFLFKVWATGQWKIGECVIVFQFSGYMLSLSFLVSVLSFSNQKPCVTNPMSILYISPMTDKKTTHHIGSLIRAIRENIKYPRGLHRCRPHIIPHYGLLDPKIPN